MQQRIYDVIAGHGPITDRDIEQAAGLTGSQVGPRRLELYLLGLIREVGRQPAAGGRTRAVWALVPAEEISHARAKASQRQPRRRRLADLPADRRARLVLELLSDADVDRLVRDAAGPGARRAHARAKDAQRHREQARRDLNARIREAQADRSFDLYFLKAKRRLADAGEAARAIAEFVERDIAERHGGGGEPLVAERHWPEVISDLDDVVRLASAARSRLDVLLHGEADVYVLDDDDVTEVLELESG